MDSASPSGASASSRVSRRLLFGAIGALLLGGIAVGLWFGLLRDNFVPKKFRHGRRRQSLSQRTDFPAADWRRDRSLSHRHDHRFERLGSVRTGISRPKSPFLHRRVSSIFAFRYVATRKAESSGMPTRLKLWSARNAVACPSSSIVRPAQRTGACVAFYRLLVRGEPAESVYAELPRYGWDPKTDQILIDYANSNMRTLAELLVARHVIERVPDKLPQLHP